VILKGLVLKTFKISSFSQGRSSSSRAVTVAVRSGNLALLERVNKWIGYWRCICSPLQSKEGRGKREEGRGKREEGRGKSNE